MRKLVSIQKILEFYPIPGKDRIEMAKILGWNVVVRKGLFSVGDLVVFCEIDTKFDNEIGKEFFPELEFSNFIVKGFSVKSKDKRILSQGFVFPIETLKKISEKTIPFKLEEGEDVTNVVKAEKFEITDQKVSSGLVEGNFPLDLVPQTDEIRLQTCLSVLDELQGLPAVIRIKMDGTSWTCLRSNGNNIVCSRNKQIKNPKISNVPSIYWEMFEKFNFNEILDRFPNLAFQGELVGPNIQSNKLKLKTHDLFIFTVYDIKKSRRLSQKEMENLIQNHIPSLKLCPKVLEIKKFNETLESLQKISDNLKYECGNPAEGIVVRPLDEIFSETLNGPLSFKLISQNFLLKDTI